MLNRFALQPDGKIGHATLMQQGPRIQIQVGIPSVLAQSLSAKAETIPAPIGTTALIDTGASGTSVDEQLLAKLALRPVGNATLQTPSHTNMQANVYAVRMNFPQAPGVPAGADPINVIGCKLANQGIGVLLGRDFLAGAVLIYNGPGGFYTLAF